MIDQERKRRTRRLIQKGGVVELSEIEAIIGDNLPTLLGLLREAAERAKQDPKLISRWNGKGSDWTDEQPDTEPRTHH